MDAFWITVQIMLGILSPLIVVAIFVGMMGIAKGIGPALELKLDEVKKLPPFDDVEVNVNPATRVMTARFIKNDVVIWQGSVTRNEINDEK